MITTADGYKAKRGQYVWQFGRDIETRKMVPCRAKVHSKYDHPIKEEHTFVNLITCKKACNLINKGMDREEAIKMVTKNK